MIRRHYETSADEQNDKNMLKQAVVLSAQISACNKVANLRVTFVYLIWYQPSFYRGEGFWF